VGGVLYSEGVEECRRTEELRADAILAFNSKYKGLTAYSDNKLVNIFALEPCSSIDRRSYADVESLKEEL
jgi:hypothetical protein